MRENSLIDKYLLVKPTIRVLIEWPILIVIGIIGTIFHLLTIPFYPITNILGAIVLIIGVIIHEYSHKIHKQMHQQSEKIEELITKGIYSKIRHLGYFGLILIFFGFAFAWGIVWLLVPVVIFSIFTVLTAIKEEEILKEKFGKEYEEYMRRVPQRFIPKIF
ncbi:isoprenylcysteine carboxylmethyltransferase family protein [Candidatus Borrarchaeum sp.]|uniref:methyltransferase family protein n=1 Tax=Candidatus Borrarchaeum sp. TaxID=2846742 RepID=UPI0025801FB0|nr:isoprenylcysteine carboxylmethyltransferase family protein [Candidatus Borrarchaeum sp.]